MTSDFPSIAFSSAQSKWIGKSCIVSPSVRRALDNWELTRQKKVLDVGCGTGHIGHDILVHGASEVVGLDSSEEMIEIARDTFKDKRHQFLHGSMLSADLHGFDVAVAFFSLHFVKNKEELTKVSCIPSIRIYNAFEEIILLSHSIQTLIILTFCATFASAVFR
ncbi:methyltransferase domain protein [Oesophagostomum dentatum]|uniref:Methyltransferase domain protein n=1 Tax=Oesophagostomum dentatum TaxID=61180 RepID=A0A0B1SE96_OESDE|nr:methyltransferase domain protein [Oesophagostomum dentatum]